MRVLNPAAIAWIVVLLVAGAATPARVYAWRTAADLPEFAR